MGRSILTSLRAFFHRHRGVILVALAALAVRLGWNLWFHPPLRYAFSDMSGYLDRADAVLDDRWRPPPLPAHPGALALFDWAAGHLFGQPSAGLTLYPYGTHVLLFAVKRVFGRQSGAAVGGALAVIGALAVAYTYATAARFAPSRRGRRWVAIVLVFYYPWISLGGYALSEAPFTACVAASAYHGLALADRGRRRDAWLLGLWLAAGAAVRPQILAAAALLAVHFVVRRRAWKGFTAGLVPRVAAPLALVLGLSACRIYWHDGHDHWGLVSQNGPLNAVFGRCHNTSLEATARDTRGFFGPPSLGALLAYEKAGGHPILRLDPAMGAALSFRGHMWDAEPNRRLAARCVRVTGPWRQVRYALSHVVLLWGYNLVWPDSGARLAYRVTMAIFGVAHGVFILPPAALSMLLAFRRRRARSMLLALHAWSVVLMAMLYFGDTRYRVPYDGVLTVLAVAMYPELLRRIRWAVRTLRERRA